MIELIKISEKDKTVWNEFVLNHKDGNFFQTYDYFSLFKNDSKNRAFAYGISDGINLLGVIVGVIESNLFPPINKLTSRAIIRGGPLVKEDNKDILKVLLNEFNNRIKPDCIYTQIRNLFNTADRKEIFRNAGLNYIQHLDILIDISRDEQSIIKDINSNRRGNIHKSINRGTLFLELTDLDAIKKGIDLIHQTYKRAKLPVPASTFFINAYTQLNQKNILKVFGAYSENTLIGVRFELCFKEMIYDWYAGSDLNYKNRYPNDFLPYHILLWGAKNGYKVFDFGGAGKPGIPYGVREHKIKFGGELVEFGRYQSINKPSLMKLGEIGMSLYQRIKMKYE